MRISFNFLFCHFYPSTTNREVNTASKESVFPKSHNSAKPPSTENQRPPSMTVLSCSGSSCLSIRTFFSINLFIYLFIYFWLRWVFVAVRGLSLVVASRGYSSLLCTGFSLRCPLLLHSTGSRCVGFSSCGTRAQQLWLAGSTAQAQ